MDPERILINKCIDGSKGAWEQFIEKYSPLIYYTIQKVLRSRGSGVTRDDVGELHNDIFVSIMDRSGRKLRQYEGKNGCSVSTWIRTIAVRATLDHLRKRRPSLSLTDESSRREAEKKAPPGTDPLHLLEEQEQKKILSELIAALAPRDQLFIKLCYYDEIPPREIAKMLKSSPNAVYSRGNYLREKLKEGLSGKLSKKNSRIPSI